jgi:hypothetical protein
MITVEEAKGIANQYLNDLEGRIGAPLQSTKIRSEPFGWIFLSIERVRGNREFQLNACW